MAFVEFFWVMVSLLVVVVISVLYHFILVLKFLSCLTVVYTVCYSVFPMPGGSISHCHHLMTVAVVVF